jgi:hypothetical protein
MEQTPDVNPYQAPKAELDVPVVPVAGGSLEDALAGRYDFNMSEVMSEAWRLTRGFKATFWGALIVIQLMYLAALGIITVVVSRAQSPILALVLQMGVAAAMTPLHLGLFMMGVRRAGGQPVSFGTAFSFFDRAGSMVGAMLLTGLLSSFGLLLLLVPGIYLGVAYIMTAPLIGDRRLRAWQAMETSRKALTHKWWRVFGFLLVLYLIVASAISLLLIPLIWALPWALVCMGVLYRRIFGSAEDATGIAPEA